MVGVRVTISGKDERDNRWHKSEWQDMTSKMSPGGKHMDGEQNVVIASDIGARLMAEVLSHDKRLTQ